MSNQFIIQQLPGFHLGGGGHSPPLPESCSPFEISGSQWQVCTVIGLWAGHPESHKIATAWLWLLALKCLWATRNPAVGKEPKRASRVHSCSSSALPNGSEYAEIVAMLMQALGSPNCFSHSRGRSMSVLVVAIEHCTCITVHALNFDFTDARNSQKRGNTRWGSLPLIPIMRQLDTCTAVCYSRERVKL